MTYTCTQVKEVNVLFVDNPVGSGYSYVDFNEALTTDVQQITNDLTTVLTTFMEYFPQFRVGADTDGHFADIIQSYRCKHKLSFWYHWKYRRSIASYGKLVFQEPQLLVGASNVSGFSETWSCHE